VVDPAYRLPPVLSHLTGTHGPTGGRGLRPIGGRLRLSQASGKCFQDSDANEPKFQLYHSKNVLKSDKVAHEIFSRIIFEGDEKIWAFF
jgi:hypothetical protein